MMFIVDTNVPVVANGYSGQASPECVLVCVQRLDAIRRNGRLLLDDNWWILKEYLDNLHSSGQPGVGDAFLLWVLRNQSKPEHCELTKITPIDPSDPNETDFVEFPDDPALAGFDPHDRKFVAVACSHSEHPPILEATDQKWRNFKEALLSHDVVIDFLCGENPSS